MSSPTLQRMFSLGTALLNVVLAVGSASAAGEPDRGFDGVWQGEIQAPNGNAEFGLGFTPTSRGQLVSLHFPEMFLYSANFGEAQIQADVFQLPALNLTLTRNGDLLEGSFGPAKLPVRLHRGGHFSEAPPAVELPPAPAPAWIAPLGAAAWASPVVHDDVVYVGTVDGAMHAVGADGKERWTWRGPNPLYGTAATTDDSLYFVDDRGDLVALVRATGALRWRTPLRGGGPTAAAASTDETFNHRTATPISDGKGTLYVGSADGGVYAVRARTGGVLWRHDVKARVYARIGMNGDELLIGCYDGSLVRLNRKNQRESLRVKLAGPIVSTPVLVGEQLVVGSRDYLLSGVNAATGKITWRNSYWFSWVESTPLAVGGDVLIGGSDFRRVSRLSAATGAKRWSTDVRGLSWGTPVLQGETVYAATAGQQIQGTVITHVGGILALDFQTGAIRWWHRAPAPAEAKFTGFPGSVAVVANYVVAAGVDGTLVALPLR